MLTDGCTRSCALWAGCCSARGYLGLTRMARARTPWRHSKQMHFTAPRIEEDHRYGYDEKAAHKDERDLAFAGISQVRVTSAGRRIHQARASSAIPPKQEMIKTIARVAC